MGFWSKPTIKDWKHLSHGTVTNVMLPSFQCPFGLSVQVDPVHLKAVVAEVDDEDLIVTKLRHSVEAAVGSS